MKRIILLVLGIVVLALAGAGAWTYYDLRTPITHAKTGQYIEIPRGSSPSAIVKKLVAGDYYVQVRHYNRSGGTGNYTVRVRR